MNPADVFVGGVAIALGVIALAAAIGNWDRCYQLAKVRWLESLGGRAASRVAYGLVGAGLIVLGLSIILGYRLVLLGPSRPAPKEPVRKARQPDGDGHRAASATDNERYGTRLPWHLATQLRPHA